MRQYSTVHFAQAGEINNFSFDLRIFGRLWRLFADFRHGLLVPGRLWQNFTLLPLAAGVVEIYFSFHCFLSSLVRSPAFVKIFSFHSSSSILLDIS